MTAEIISGKVFSENSDQIVLTPPHFKREKAVFLLAAKLLRGTPGLQGEEALEMARKILSVSTVIYDTQTAKSV